MLRPGDKGSYDANRFRVTHMMEALVEASGDVDASAPASAIVTPSRRPSRNSCAVAMLR